MTVKINERAMLISLHRSQYSGSKVDQEVSEDARRSRNAEKGSGRFTKILVHPSFLTCVTRPLSQANTIYEQYSLPWTKGARIMTNVAFPTFTQEMHAQRVLVERGKLELLKKEADIHAEAKHRLQGMYKADDYPSIQEIADSFSMKVEINKVPEAGDFRVKLSNESLNSIVKDIEEATKERLDKAANDVFMRVFGVVDTMVKTLKEYQPKTDTTKGKSFKDSLIYNVQEVADLLPKLNVTVDPRVDDLRTELLDDLTQTNGAILKQNAKARNDTIAKAERLLRKIEGYVV